MIFILSPGDGPLWLERYFSTVGNSILILRPLNITFENCPAATWCKVRRLEPCAATSLTWTADWQHDRCHCRSLIYIFFQLVLNCKGLFAADCRGFLWVSPLPVVFYPFLCWTSMSSVFCRPNLSTLQWMENILVLLPKHRQEHRLCRRTAACALLQVFSGRVFFSQSLWPTSTPCRPL